MKIVGILKGLGVIFASGVRVILILQSRAVDFTQHQGYQGNLIRQQENYARLDQDVLNTRFRVIVSYDPLVQRMEDLHYLLSNLQDIFTLKTQDKGLDLRFEISADLPRHVRTDPNKLRQILSNLLSNGIKFTPEGTVILRAYVLNSRSLGSDQAPSEIDAKFEIEETGYGIAKEEIDTLFEPFITKPFQVEEVIARIETHLSIRHLQDQLREKNKALEATLQMREDLSRMVIHDLKNPVSTILLYSSALLNREALQDRAYQRVDVINQAAQRLQGLITDLLMLAKMESGKLLLNHRQVDLYELILSVTQDLHPLAEERNCDLRLRWPVIIELSYGATSAFPKRQAELRVTDQGPGIPAALQQTIFDRFDVGLSRETIPQIGLGLAFCKMVVEAHGGQIRVEGNQPNGAIFVVEV